ncbi:hypothetical protein [Rhizobium sp. SG570]|uniref:hypothetical protein n=1 Tax=Rhizobium sp. SG570 TaxID=2587113 RepID=UPI001444EB3C|nr:hypothetical protein [Rhizobium sp. SG570]NKJ38745.1 hypothetical protein [Rhizobium sp. SG570]
MSQRLSVQAIDLRVRADYPLVRTEIYELTPSHHLIYAASETLNEADFAKPFEDHYRTLGTRVSFTNKRPEQSLIVPPIADREIGDFIAALPLTRSELQTVLAGKFPGLPDLLTTADGPGHVLTFSFENPIPEELLPKVMAFLTDCLNGRDFAIVVAPVPSGAERGADTQYDPLGIEVTSFKRLSQRPKLPQFVEAEETWWFENLRGLFEGSIPPLSFDFRDDAGIACYVNAAMPLPMDIRQALLAYDTIYIEPPITDVSRTAFWEGQSITQSEVLRLVELDRVRILHSQPEERSDLGFLQEAHSANPKGVIGRRKSAAMMVADIVETADEYLLCKPHIVSQLPELISRLAEQAKMPADKIAQAVLYPTKARRESLRPLLSSGLLGYAGIGQGPMFADIVQETAGKDIALEAGLFGREVHVAHMLDATLIPAAPSGKLINSWAPAMQFMGDRLNFYRHYNSRISAKWAENERRKENRQIVLAPIPLFEFYKNASIGDIASLTSSSVARRKGRALLSRLAGLSIEGQVAEMTKLCDGLERQKKTSHIVDAILALDSAVGVATYFTNTSVFPLVASFAMLQLALKCAKMAPVLDVVVDEIESSLREAVGLNQDLTFVSKMSRVAFLSPPPK